MTVRPSSRGLSQPPRDRPTFITWPLDLPTRQLGLVARRAERARHLPLCATHRPDSQSRRCGLDNRHRRRRSCLQ
eukprot:5183027-Prymnesium_polylepis.1